MLWALKHEVEADGFVIQTDSETYAGDGHPSQALRRYRQQTGIPARLIVVGTVSDRFTIADPDDGGMLDVVGMDAAKPDLMSSFARGEP
jgi:60 kDa SS-A/Ro ribonucleoprotein